MRPSIRCAASGAVLAVALLIGVSACQDETTAAVESTVPDAGRIEDSSVHAGGSGGAEAGSADTLEASSDVGAGGWDGACAEPGPWTPRCGANLCGNGVIDSCPTNNGGAGGMSGAEECDGEDFGTESCKNYGFPSGDLTCSASCYLSIATCNECNASPIVSYCGLAPVTSSFPVSVGLAATDQEVGLVWSEHGTGLGVWFARLDLSLALLSSTKLDGNCAQQGSYTPVALARIPSGWVAAFSVGGRLSIAGIDAQGTMTGQTVVDTGLAPANLPPTPILMAERAGAGPLVWVSYVQDGWSLRAAVVEADGLSTTTPLNMQWYFNEVSTTFADGAFYIAGYEGHSLRLARIEADGSSFSELTALPQEYVVSPRLVAGADDLRILYATAINGQGWIAYRRLSSTGDALTPAVPVVNLPDINQAIAVGSDTVFWVGLTGIGLGRIDFEGAVISAMSGIASAGLINPTVMARRGSDTVLAWTAWRKHIGMAIGTP